MLRDFSASRRRAGAAFAVAIAVCAAPLTACGIKGPLKLPPAAPSPTPPSAAAAEPPPSAAAGEPAPPAAKP